MSDGSARILVADDDASVLQSLSWLLKENGYGVTPVNGGQACLEELERDSPDLLLLDILMPGMDGKEFVRRLKKEDAIKDVPIIFITVCIDVEKDKGHEEIEVDGVRYPGFAKPLHNARLLSLIRKTLNRRYANAGDSEASDDA